MALLKIWVVPATRSIAFLDGMYASKEFAEYIPKANALSYLKGAGKLKFYIN